MPAAEAPSGIENVITIACAPQGPVRSVEINPVAVWAAWKGIEGWFEHGLWARIGSLALLVGLGVSVYGMLILALRATTVQELKEGFKG